MFILYPNSLINACNILSLCLFNVFIITSYVATNYKVIYYDYCVSYESIIYLLPYVL